ncbi:fructose-6-phosphate aldolase [Candidatus Riflebacteria bacterium]
MEFFIDTADIDEIKKAHSFGLLDGVTTNPSLVAKTGRPFEEVCREIIDLKVGPVSVEAISTNAKGMLKEGRTFARWGDDVVIKIIMTLEGLKAVKVLNEEGIKTNVTLVFNPMQGLMAAKAGATYVSPFIGRIDDTGHDGLDLIANLTHIFDNYAFETKILAASIRHVGHVLDAALLGADVATIPFKVLSELVYHPLTEKGIQSFLNDYKKIPKKKKK